MSERNVELYRRIVEAFHARGRRGVYPDLDPSVEYHSAITVPGGAVYAGTTGAEVLRRLQGRMGNEFRVEPEAFLI